MSKSTQGDQSEWAVADLSPEERKSELPELTDATPIVRYVRLSTLFHYLSNRAFIPTLSWLRDMDNQEGILGVPTPPRIQEFLNSLFEQFGDLYPFLGVSPEERKAIHINHWTYEQWRRRAIWCWNLDEGESNAMWHLYGFKGVAIKSTVGLLKKALANAGAIRYLIAPVRYGKKSDIDADVQMADANFDPRNKATWPFWLMRPYLFKNQAYRYEQEIRFVFGVDPVIAEQAGGVLIELDSNTLIQDLAFSDSIQKDEAAIIYELSRQIKKGELPNPKYPEEHQKR